MRGNSSTSCPTRPSSHVSGARHMVAGDLATMPVRTRSWILSENFIASAWLMGPSRLGSFTLMPPAPLRDATASPFVLCNNADSRQAGEPQWPNRRGSNPPIGWRVPTRSGSASASEGRNRGAASEPQLASFIYASLLGSRRARAARWCSGSADRLDHPVITGDHHPAGLSSTRWRTIHRSATPSAPISWRRSIAIPPHTATSTRCSISKASTRSRRIALRTGCGARTARI